MRKYFIIISLLLTINGGNLVYSQKTCDTLLHDYKIIQYKKVLNIYVIHVWKTDSSHYVIVSLKDNDSCLDKIEVGKTYKMKLRSYYNRSPNVHYVGRHEIRKTIWLENKKISFNTGMSYINDIYITQNLNGLCYIGEQEDDTIPQKLQVLTIRYADLNKENHLKITNEDFINDLKTKDIIIKDSLLSKEIEDKITKLKYLYEMNTLKDLNLRQHVYLLYKNSTLVLASDGKSSMELNGKPVCFDKILQELIDKRIRIETNPDGDYNKSVLDSTFIYEITENTTTCRGCPSYDYYLLLHIKYGEIEKDVIVMDDYLKFYFIKYLKYKEDTKDSIRDILVNQRRISIPARESKELNSDVYNSFLDTDYSDSIFSSLLENKEAFLNYYFDDNKEYKFGERYKEVNDEKRYIHNKLYEEAAVIYQLLKWGIPVYFCSEFKNGRYGYYKGDK
ncbi:MAG: hypothetical protein WC135_01810 [Bacteroidales bacterium]